MLPKDGQQFKNDITEGELAFGAVSADPAYGTLVDLGLLKMHNHLMIQNTLDVEVSLRFTATGSVITIEANESLTFDDFNHNGIIQCKDNGVAPTSGNIKTRSW